MFWVRILQATRKLQEKLGNKLKYYAKEKEEKTKK